MYEQLVPLLGIVFSGLFLLNTRFKRKTVSVKKEDQNSITIEELWIYPIKSCKGIKVNKADIVKTGFKYDREFMLVSVSPEGNKFMSQRSHPKIALIHTKIDESQNRLIVSANNKKDLYITLSLPSIQSNSTLQVSVWGDECVGIDIGDEAATWFCDFLQTPSLRLVRMDPSFKRSTDPKYAPDGQVLKYFVLSSVVFQVM